jgi:hypothetical protein
MSWNQGGQYGHNQQAYGPNNGQWNAGPNQWQGAGGQYPPPSQPYAAPVNPPVVGFSDYKAKTEEYGERFKPKKRINDIPFLILFIAQVCFVAAHFTCLGRLFRFTDIATSSLDLQQYRVLP